MQSVFERLFGVASVGMQVMHPYRGMQVMYWDVVVKRELSRRAKLLIHQLATFWGTSI